MDFNEIEKSVIFEKSNINIMNLAIIELGGPLHSSFAKHLQAYHYANYDEIKKKLDSSSAIDINNLHFVIDILQVFLAETLDSDWGTLYKDVIKKDVEDLLASLIEIYSVRVKKY